MTARLAVLLLGVLASLASTLYPQGEDTPEVDDCASPTTTGAVTLEIGDQSESSFRPIGADEIADLVFGDQGNDMLPLRFRITGLPAGCVSHETQVSTCDPDLPCTEANRVDIADSITGLRTYPDGTGVATRAHFVILYRSPASGAPIFIRARVAGVIAEVVLWVESVGTLADAGADAL